MVSAHRNEEDLPEVAPISVLFVDSIALVRLAFLVVVRTLVVLIEVFPIER